MKKTKKETELIEKLNLISSDIRICFGNSNMELSGSARLINDRLRKVIESI